VVSTEPLTAETPQPLVGGRLHAFEAFAREIADPLLRTAFGLTGDWGHAEDLSQHTLMQVAGAWDRLTVSPRAYAFRVLANSAVSRWRSRTRRPELLTDANPDTAAGRRYDIADVRAEDRIDQVAESQAVADALGTLPHQQRCVLVLRFVEDMSTAEVADILGISIGTVKSTASKALRRLRALDPNPFLEHRP
jgi:RNA polymerase sigma-70 factor (sigma-E family)